MLNKIKQWWKVQRCKHDAVAIITVRPVTMEPCTGECKNCGSWVLARTVWGTRVEHAQYKKAQRDRRVAIK